MKGNEWPKSLTALEFQNSRILDSLHRSVAVSQTQTFKPSAPRHPVVISKMASAQAPQLLADTLKMNEDLERVIQVLTAYATPETKRKVKQFHKPAVVVSGDQCSSCGDEWKEDAKTLSLCGRCAMHKVCSHSCALLHYQTMVCERLANDGKADERRTAHCADILYLTPEEERKQLDVPVAPTHKPVAGGPTFNTLDAFVAELARNCGVDAGLAEREVYNLVANLYDMDYDGEADTPSYNPSSPTPSTPAVTPVAIAVEPVAQEVPIVPSPAKRPKLSSH